MIQTFIFVYGQKESHTDEAVQTSIREKNEVMEKAQVAARQYQAKIDRMQTELAFRVSTFLDPRASQTLSLSSSSSSFDGHLSRLLPCSQRQELETSYRKTQWPSASMTGTRRKNQSQIPSTPSNQRNDRSPSTLRALPKTTPKAGGSGGVFDSLAHDAGRSSSRRRSKGKEKETVGPERETPGSKGRRNEMSPIAESQMRKASQVNGANVGEGDVQEVGGSGDDGFQEMDWMDDDKDRGDLDGQEEQANLDTRLALIQRAEVNFFLF